MLKTLSSLILSTLIMHSLTAATFGGPGNDHGYHIISTSDNGIAVLGQIENQTADFYLIKLDSSMNVEWTKILGDTTQYDYPIHVSQTADDGFLVTGGNLNTLQATVLKLNSAGDTLWTRSYGTDPNSIYMATYAEQFSADQLTIGIVAGPLTGVPVLFLCRTDTMGNITDTITSAYGGESVLPVANGYLITGTISDLTPPAISLVRVDTVSGHSFSKTFFDSNLNRDLRAYSSAVSGSGFLTAGWTNLYTANAGDFEFYLLQTDADGDSLWSKHWGNNHSELNEIISSGNFYYASGFTEINSVRDNLLMKLNNAGDTLWTKSLGTDLSAFSLLDNQDGYFFATGDSLDHVSGLNDIWVMMFDSLGNQVYNTTTSILNAGRQESGIELYPTVATDFIQLMIKDYSNSNSFSALIVDSGGKIIQQIRIHEKNSRIDIRNYRPGTYFLRLTNGDGKFIGVEKFVVRK